MTDDHLPHARTDLYPTRGAREVSPPARTRVVWSAPGDPGSDRRDRSAAASSGRVPRRRSADRRPTRSAATAPNWTG